MNDPTNGPNRAAGGQASATAVAPTPLRARPDPRFPAGGRESEPEALTEDPAPRAPYHPRARAAPSWSPASRAAVAKIATPAARSATRWTRPAPRAPPPWPPSSPEERDVPPPPRDPRPRPRQDDRRRGTAPARGRGSRSATRGSSSARGRASASSTRKRSSAPSAAAAAREPEPAASVSRPQLWLEALTEPRPPQAATGACGGRGLPKDRPLRDRQIHPPQLLVRPRDLHLHRLPHHVVRRAPSPRRRCIPPRLHSGRGPSGSEICIATVPVAPVPLSWTHQAEEGFSALTTFSDTPLPTRGSRTSGPPPSGGAPPSALLARVGERGCHSLGQGLERRRRRRCQRPIRRRGTRF